MSEYTARDIVAQGEHYIRHVSAMTDEDLHDKSDIAAELAHRDIESERLHAELREAQKENSNLRGLLGNSAKDCPYCGLPAVDQAKCPHGFPGCMRADDQQLSKHFADAYALEQTEIENATLKEQLAAREADVAAILKWHESYTSISETFDLMKVLKKSGNHHLREHEARLLEEVKEQLSDMRNFDSRLRFYDYLNEQIAARRTK